MTEHDFKNLKTGDKLKSKSSGMIFEIKVENSEVTTQVGKKTFTLFIPEEWEIQNDA